MYEACYYLCEGLPIALSNMTNMPKLKKIQDKVIIGHNVRI